MRLYPLTEVKEFRLKLYVKDFGESKSFYQDFLGYPVIKEWDRGEQDKGLMFDTGTTVLEVLTPEDGYRSLQGVDVSLEVEDVWKLWGKVKDYKNVVFELRDNDWGDTSFKIKDPDGFGLTFFTRH